MQTLQALRKFRGFDSLTLRDYRLLWLGQLSTSMGQWMDQLTRTWLIFQLTNSPLQLGLVSAVRGIPMIVFGTIAGAVADRYGRKRQLIIAQVVNALLNIVLATLVFTGQVQPWHVYVTGFLAGTVQAFQQPARQVLINDIVGPDHLLNAIALNSAALNVSRSVGPAISGIIITVLGVDGSYFAQAVLYALATVWTIQIVIPEKSLQVTRTNLAKNKSLLGSTKEGLSYCLSNRLILALMVLGLAPMVLGMPFTSLMPIFAVDIFHGGAETQAALLTGFGIGAVMGALVVASIGKRQINGKLLIGGAAVFGISLIFFSQSPVVWLAMGSCWVAGFSNSQYTSQDQTIIQLMAPANLRGRVLGIYLLNRGLMPFGSLLLGVLATFIGAPLSVAIMGVACFVLAVAVAFFVPKLWNLKSVPEMEVETVKA